MCSDLRFVWRSFVEFCLFSSLASAGIFPILLKTQVQLSSPRLCHVACKRMSRPDVFLIKNVSFLPKENSKVLIYCSSINYYLLLFFVIYCTKNDILMPHLLSCWTLWFIVFLLVLLGMVFFFTMHHSGKPVVSHYSSHNKCFKRCVCTVVPFSSRWWKLTTRRVVNKHFWDYLS